MFGLKIISKKEYLNLQTRLKDLEVALSEKKSVIISLESEISNLNNKLFELKKDAATPVSTPTRDAELVLLTDVAETPLKVEKKQEKKRVSKKTSENKPKRRKIVHRQSEN